MTHNNNANPSPEGLRTLESLREAVRNALEKKRRLGQYAIIWQDNKPVRIGEGEEASSQEATSE